MSIQQHNKQTYDIEVTSELQSTLSNSMTTFNTIHSTWLIWNDSDSVEIGGVSDMFFKDPATLGGYDGQLMMMWENLFKKNCKENFSSYLLLEMGRSFA